MAHHLGRFVDVGLMAVFDHRYYLSELGMKRAANMGRILPGSVQQHHGADLERFDREHDKRHNDGVNRLGGAVPPRGSGCGGLLAGRDEPSLRGGDAVRPAESAVLGLLGGSVEARSSLASTCRSEDCGPRSLAQTQDPSDPPHRDLRDRRATYG